MIKEISEKGLLYNFKRGYNDTLLLRKEGYKSFPDADRNTSILEKIAYYLGTSHIDFFFPFYHPVIASQNVRMYGLAGKSKA